MHNEMKGLEGFLRKEYRPISTKVSFKDVQLDYF